MNQSQSTAHTTASVFFFGVDCQQNNSNSSSPDRPTHLLVVHVLLLLPLAPAVGDLFGVDELELAEALQPNDAVLVGDGAQLLQQKLPQLDETTFWNQQIHSDDVIYGFRRWFTLCDKILRFDGL